jgi:UDP-glucose 4-epimerase
MKYFITGGAGFIGSNLVDRLLSNGHEIVVYDNMSTGFQDFLLNAFQSKHFSFVMGDTLNRNELTKAMQTCDFVFHLAANADVRFGTDHPEKDLQQNTIATYNVLEAMRTNGIKKIVFSSSGSIYGEAKIIPTPKLKLFPLLRIRRFQFRHLCTAHQSWLVKA